MMEQSSTTPGLSGQTALVTGAAGGIGCAVALTLARAGANIAINHFETPGAAEALADDIRRLGRRALVVAADVGDESAVAGMFRAIDEAFGRLDILIANAGITRPLDIFDTSLADWNEVLRTNLTGTFLTAKEAMIRMREAGQGAIIIMGSVVGHQGALKGHVAYGATKAGLHGMAKTLARTGAPLGIRVNAVAPGIVDTDLLINTHGAAGIVELKARVPLGELASVEDVAEAALYLVGPAGRHITGTVLDVNGGMLMR
jgi:3-oxoacyl-[acyl-carrier protein] reductase